jgi:hypothetical protein
VTYGAGKLFGDAEKARYLEIKQLSAQNINYPVQWALLDIDSGKLVTQSNNASMQFYGASVVKVFTAAAYLDSVDGVASTDDLQLLSDMIAVSSNSAWRELQKRAGGGDDLLGMRATKEITARAGLTLTRGWRGFLDREHGNEINARELVTFMKFVYENQFLGAETLWKLMYTCRTGGAKAAAYLPATMAIGGKTGTYSGGSLTTRVSVNHQVITFAHHGHQYALAVLSDNHSSNDIAVMAGGVVREYLKLVPSEQHLYGDWYDPALRIDNIIGFDRSVFGGLFLDGLRGVKEINIWKNSERGQNEY